MRNFLIFFSLLFIAPIISEAAKLPKESKTIYVSSQGGQRVGFGAKRLLNSLIKAGYEVKLTVINYKEKLPKGKSTIVIGTANDKVLDGLFPAALKNQSHAAGKEGFSTSYDKDGALYIIGADNSGTLYGCIDLSEKVASGGKIPTQLAITDHP
ncbi:MAG: hypothetical protein EOO91_07895, partial [Pedobacter sp.]